ncbi:hypothetical protein HWV62_7950 [Athelia sp. TMB]|nr:hypothetical protein HWV62_7950 [Athelia sp. TMB]
MSQLVSSSQKRSGPREIKWTRSLTTEEKATCLTHLPQYLQLTQVRGKKYDDFWIPLWQTFFAAHPLSPLTAEEIESGLDQGERKGERMQIIKLRVREWFNNHCRTTTAGMGRRAALDLVKDSKTRMLAAYQAYHSMFKDRLEPIIKQEWIDSVMSERLTEEAKAKPIPPIPINFRNAASKRMLQEEPADVQNEVDEWRRAQRNNSSKVEDEGDEEAQRLRIANRYHKAQQALVPTIQSILENIEEQTGMIGFFTVVGPQPIRGGNLGSITIFHGRNDLKHDFGEVYTTERWKNNIETPLMEFAATVFSPSVRASRALDIADGMSSRSRSISVAPSRSASAMPPMTSMSAASTNQAPYAAGATPQEDPEAEPQENIEDGDPLYEHEPSSYAYPPIGDEHSEVFTQPLQSVPDALPSKNASVADGASGTESPPLVVAPGSLGDPQTDGEGQVEIGAKTSIAGWDNGEDITAEERAVLLAMESDAERLRAMRIRQRDREQFDDGLIRNIPPIVPKVVASVPKPKASTKSKASKKGGQSTDGEGGKNDRSALKKPSPLIPSSTTLNSSQTSSSFATNPDVPPSEETRDAGWPEWVVVAMPHLQALSDDVQWTSLLDKWIELERQLGFPQKGRSKAFVLIPTHRPAPLSNWIHDGCVWDELPNIVPGIAQDYSTSWWLWWRAMQPAWRAESLSQDLRGTGDFNWGETRKGTQNGFFLMVLSVGLWLRGRGKGRDEWRCGDALREVHWVIGQMLNSGNSPTLGKRGRNNCDTDKPLGKRIKPRS